MELAAYLLLTVLIVMGRWTAFCHNLATNAPYNRPDSIGEWWWSVHAWLIALAHLDRPHVRYRRRYPAARARIR
jgi:hypothetical protein